jgi:hypothetical protein
MCKKVLFIHKIMETFQNSIDFDLNINYYFKVSKNKYKG